MLALIGEECAGQDGGEVAMRQVCTEVAGLLNSVASAEDDETTERPTPATAPNRFAAAVQAALSSNVSHPPRFVLASPVSALPQNTKLSLASLPFDAHLSCLWSVCHPVRNTCRPAFLSLPG